MAGDRLVMLFLEFRWLFHIWNSRASATHELQQDKSSSSTGTLKRKKNQEKSDYITIQQKQTNTSVKTTKKLAVGSTLSANVLPTFTRHNVLSYQILRFIIQRSIFCVAKTTAFRCFVLLLVPHTLHHLSMCLRFPLL